MALQLGHKIFGIEARADHDQRRCLVQLFIREDNLERIVLRLEAADIEDVVLSSQPEALQHVRVTLRRKVRAVGDGDRICAVLFTVVTSDHLGVGDDSVGETHRERLADGVPRAAKKVPLAPATLDAIDVDGHGQSRRAEKRKHEGVRRIA